MPGRPMPIAALLDLAAAQLHAAGIAEARREARLLLGHTLDLDAAALLRDRGRLVDPAPFLRAVARRVAREPLAHITRRQGFWSLDLEVDPATLIPRADSETLIEAACAAFPDRRQVRRVLDLGTGTGCLLLAALVEFTEAFGVGVELAEVAGRVAAANIAASGLAGRAQIVRADWAACLAGRFDLILCNPPYIPSLQIAALMPEVALHEPRAALDGGASGLGAYAALFPAVPALLAPDGVAIFELGVGQQTAVRALAEAAGLDHVSTRPDLAGIARALVLRRGGRKKCLAEQRSPS